MTATVEPNYFTCTLGQAAQRRRDGIDTLPQYSSILAMIDEQSRCNPDALAVGLADFIAGCTALSFREVQATSLLAARRLEDCGLTFNDSKQTRGIGLSCKSGLDFIKVWLGLMRLGWTPLLIAPQLQSSAIVHLCNKLDIHTIIFDDADRQVWKEMPAAIHLMQSPSLEDYDNTTHSAEKGLKQATPSSDLAFWHHSSGTSSGLPKPIEQYHTGSCGVLPRFAGPNKPATFSTTPLYHGGVADCLRSWTSGAAIWLFPEGVVPITAMSIMQAVEVARCHCAVSVQYFSSVPYVLQMLVEDENGIQFLVGMDLVGVGGAALPSPVGDRLVKAGVKLLSRFGSTECGFLLSSHRDYTVDNEWQYLRSTSDLLQFEKQDDGLSELVVTSHWPLLAITNREDGSYATSDLFEQHEKVDNAFKPCGRADGQITLLNGKKFDPTALEDSIVAASSILDDMYIFGAERPCPGALLFTKSPLSPEAVIEDAWPIIEASNTQSDSHARIPRSMLTVLEAKYGLEKSSKGTTLRTKVEAKYRQEIEDAYFAKPSIPADTKPMIGDDIRSSVLECFRQVLGRDVDPSEDLYRQGVDSLACIHIKTLVEQTCLMDRDVHLSMNVIYDHETVDGLSEYIDSLRTGKRDKQFGDTVAEDMLAMVQNHSSFQRLEGPLKPSSPAIVVLTGATGFLGSRVLKLLSKDPNVSKIYCLVRAASNEAAQVRIDEVLETLGARRSNEKHSASISAWAADLTANDLGVEEQDRKEILKNATHFIHAAWTVNFKLRLRSLEDQIVATRNLIDTAMESNARFSFISSVAAVGSSKSTSISEAISTEPNDASPVGYGQSKWVAEGVCHAANAEYRRSGVKDAISIIRVGQLCGDKTGAWNAREAYPLLLSTAKSVGCLPDLPHEALNWIGVDVAAQAVRDIAIREGVQTAGLESPQRETSVFHVLNPSHSTRWADMLAWIKSDGPNPPFEIVTSGVWMARLEAKQGDQPWKSLVDFWKKTYCGDHTGGKEKSVPGFEIARSQHISGAMNESSVINRENVIGMWRWILNNVRA